MHRITLFSFGIRLRPFSVAPFPQLYRIAVRMYVCMYVHLRSIVGLPCPGWVIEPKIWETIGPWLRPSE